MEVNDYVRTKSYGIKKINGFSSTLEEDFIDCDYDKTTRILINKKDIIKSSPNIIDLIGLGDLVRIETEKDDTNIFEVVAINYNDGEIGVFNNNFEFDWASIEQLKSIVTKEQFESMEYKVE